MPGHQSASRQPVPPKPMNTTHLANSQIESRPLPQPDGASPQPVQTARAAPKPYTPPKSYVASRQPKSLGTMPVNGSSAPKLKSGTTVSTYKVQPGDSLWIIAKRNGTSVKALREANNMDGSKIRLGQTLIIPGGSASGPVQVAAVAPATMNDAETPSRLPESRRPADPHRP